MSESESNDELLSSGDELPDSDLELQEAFARGELKPGLVVLKTNESTQPTKQPPVNNVPRLQSLLKSMQLPSSFSWVERLDVVSDLAPLAPEIAVQLEDHREKREKEIHVLNARKKEKKGSAIPSKTIEEDPIHNDFKRELNFHRQAQSAIMTCLPKLKALGIPTKRPEDYFAEMAKSDSHMQKVASVLLKKQTAAEKAEKVRKMRDQKKFAKQTQIQVLQERQKEKKEMIENVKKYRKGQKNSLDFLEERKSFHGKKNSTLNRKAGKREMKNERYGYGGQKKGAKRNTRESLDNVPDRSFRGGRGRGRGGSGGRMGNMSRGARGGRSPNDRPRFEDRGQGRGGRGGMSRGGGGAMRGGRGGSRGKPKRPGKSNRMKQKANASG